MSGAGPVGTGTVPVMADHTDITDAPAPAPNPGPFTVEEFWDAAAKAVTDINAEMGTSTAHVDLMNLLVVVTGSYLQGKAETVAAVVEEEYEDSFEDVEYAIRR